eukprot:Skav218995  [mRNA]  locus=scaffold169:267806:269398:+ [translate_table: standard]
MAPKKIKKRKAHGAHGPALPKSKRPPKLRPMGQLVYPPNSGGDLFRLLPFEGYSRVISFLSVQQLPQAARVCLGWQYAVGCREKIDASITCKNMGSLEKFLKSLLRKDQISAIRVDTSENTTEEDLYKGRYNHGLPSLFRIKRLTWKCKDFSEDHMDFLEFMFPDLETLKLDIQSGDGARDLNIKLPNLSIVAKGRRSRRINAHRLTSLSLDLDKRWWEDYGDRFESGILDWIRGKPRIIRFRMPPLSRHLQANIQRLLRERRKTCRWTSDSSDDEFSSDEFAEDFPYG